MAKGKASLPATFLARDSSEGSGCRGRCSGWDGAPDDALPEPAVGRTAAAGGGGADDRGRPLILLAHEPTGNLDFCIGTHDPRYPHATERTIHSALKEAGFPSY